MVFCSPGKGCWTRPPRDLFPEEESLGARISFSSLMSRVEPGLSSRSLCLLELSTLSNTVMSHLSTLSLLFPFFFPKYRSRFLEFQIELNYPFRGQDFLPYILHLLYGFYFLIIKVLALFKWDILFANIILHLYYCFTFSD